MERKGRAWCAFVFTRVAGAVCDTALMALAYYLAFGLRLDFAEPVFGWRAAALSFITVWGVQMAALGITGCYGLSWRRTLMRDVPRWAGALALAAGLLAFLRIALPDVAFAHARPPYSVAVINAVLATLLLVGVRVLWRFRCERTRNDLKLLGRDETPAAGSGVRAAFAGQTVLVTGAGGSIGSEIVRQTVAAGAARVLMVDRSENALYEIDRAMREAGHGDVCTPRLADIADESRLRSLLTAYRPQLVLHAAAYKHVPMVEANPLEGMRNNALATRRLGEWCRDAGVTRFVMISTDKAVNPRSVMGFTKRLAEVLLLGLEGGDSPCTFSCVRFGNVLGSSGSVVPLFREQIARGGPVTVTDPGMRRYFMSTSEAVSLVLEASHMPGGRIYTLDMGESVSIVDLAEDMIRQAGYKPYVDIPIVFSGIRPGEKLFEELDVSEKSAYRTGHARIFVNRDPFGAADGCPRDLPERCVAFAAREPSGDAVRDFLKEACDGFAGKRGL